MPFISMFLTNLKYCCSKWTILQNLFIYEIWEPNCYFSGNRMHSSQIDREFPLYLMFTVDQKTGQISSEHFMLAYSDACHFSAINFWQYDFFITHLFRACLRLITVIYPFGSFFNIQEKSCPLSENKLRVNINTVIHQIYLY